MIVRARLLLKLRYESASIHTTNVEIAVIAPINELSCCVTPCWIRSPITMMRMSSKAESSASSFRPIVRITMNRNTNITDARATICIREPTSYDSEP